jgi:predicted AlkP superfamily pyrophosphatase or phosphodiesterase
MIKKCMNNSIGYKMKHHFKNYFKSRFCFIFLFSTLSFLTCYSQEKNPPKLVVGIVVDQFRYDLLYRYSSNFSTGGFRRILNDGYSAHRMFYNYAPTYTAPGHAAIYTGSTPAINGIAANDWYDYGKTPRYCVQDDSARSIGGSEKAGKMSPKNLKVGTWCDQLKLYTNDKSKVYTLALKDRGAILPGGSMADAAYWYDYISGRWITSSFYMDTLPYWVQKFNKDITPKKLLQNGWHLSKPASTYTYHSKDNAPWEEDAFKLGKTSFPYIFDTTTYHAMLRKTPFGNKYTTDIALELLKNEKLGMTSYTDFLGISYSSTDYVGHAFGPYSIETEDTYYQLDLDIKRLLEALDLKFGKDNFWVFMTGDHGVQDVPDFLKSNKINGGTIDEKWLHRSLDSFFVSRGLPANCISHVFNEQIYLNKEILDSNDIELEDITEKLSFLPYQNYPGIQGLYSFESLATAPLPAVIKERLIKGYYPNRSGDIAILLDPNWNTHGTKGTTHGTPYSHDAHVPFLFYGKGVKPYSSSIELEITDIAPTLSLLLGILEPNGCIGKFIPDLDYLRKK